MSKKNIFIAVIALIVAGCSLDLKPVSGPSTGDFPSSKAEAEAGVYAAYEALLDNDLAIHVSWWRGIDMITDNSVYRTSGAAGQLLRSEATPSHAWVKRLYQKVYQAIAANHLVLDNLDDLAGKVDAETLAIMKAELLTLRAFCYDLLVQHYGDVPWIDHSLSLDDRLYPRTPKAEIVSNLLSDLSDDVISALPERWEKSVYGTTRISQVAAYTIKARLYLNHATDENGYYELAAKYARKAIDIAVANGHTLAKYDLTYYPTHVDGEPFCELFNYAGENDDEWIWSLQYNYLVEDLNVNIYYLCPRILNGAAGFGPTQQFIDAFQCKDGKSIVESELYDWKNPWANRDPRLDLFCVRDNSRTLGVQYSINIKNKMVFDYHTGAMITNADITGNKSEYGPNGAKGPGGYLWRKGYDEAFYGNITGASTSQTQDDINVGLIRLSELYLIEAEALIECNKNLSQAADNINLIRARVEMPAVTASDQAGLRSALRYERMIELCNEGFRWYDLRRWGIAEKAQNRDYMAPGFSTEDNPTNFISNVKPAIDADWIVTHGTETWDGNVPNLRKFDSCVFVAGEDELWPIPKSEMDANTAITYQNPGY